jgi:hypothetical protein
MAKYKCLTSVYVEEILYTPNEVLELAETVARQLIGSGNVEAVAKPVDKPVAEKAVETEDAQPAKVVEPKAKAK